VGRGLVRLLLLAVAAVLFALVAGCSGKAQPPLPTIPPPPTSVPGSSLPPIPAGLPTTLQLGMANGQNEASTMTATAPFGYRYQYLAGGLKDGWATWSADGGFATSYIQESVAAHMVPVFSYYMLQQSVSGGSEQSRIAKGLGSASLMKAYFADLALLFRKAGAFPGTTVVVQLEPDLWGFMQQKASSDDARTVKAKIADVPGMGDLPETLAGFAQAIVRLRDQLAPNVLLGYHVSTWGTGNDFIYTDPPDATVQEIASREATFYRSLGADFDLVFAEFSDRDAGFKQAQQDDHGASWFTDADFARHALFLQTVSEETGKRIVLWQIPYGNTKMAAENNTWNHYQDNRVEKLLDDPSRALLQRYAQAGVIALLFGRGADGATDASDGANDGVTNPAPINGNAQQSTSADDDGGFFRTVAKDYYQQGALKLS
jgi:hypothetical protein